MKTYKTYTMHTVGRLTVYLSDDTHCVHQAVAWESSNPVTLYPYIRRYRGDGWDNACDYLTLSAVRARLARGTLIFS